MNDLTIRVIQSDKTDSVLINFDFAQTTYNILLRENQVKDLYNKLDKILFPEDLNFEERNAAGEIEGAESRA